jgi:hypothetical protein
VKAQQSRKVELRHQSAWKAKFPFEKLFCHGKARCIFKRSSRVFGTNGHCVLILCSLELQSGLHLRLLDIAHETRKDLFSNKYNSFCLRLILSTFPKDRQFFFAVRTPTLIAYVSGV